jgi:hypothetical protein
MNELHNTMKLAWITEGEIVYTIHTYRSGILTEGIPRLTQVRLRGAPPTTWADGRWQCMRPYVCSHYDKCYLQHRNQRGSQVIS